MSEKLPDGDEHRDSDEDELIDCYAIVVDEHDGVDYDKAKADAKRMIEKIRDRAYRAGWADGYMKGRDVGDSKMTDE